MHVPERQVRLPRILLSAPLGYALVRQNVVLWVQSSGQPFGLEGYAVGGPGLEHPAAHVPVAGRHRPEAQSAPSGVGWVLRTVRAFGAVSSVPVRQSDTTGLGAAEVQALQCGATIKVRSARQSG